MSNILKCILLVVTSSIFFFLDTYILKIVYASSILFLVTNAKSCAGGVAAAPRQWYLNGTLNLIDQWIIEYWFQPVNVTLGRLQCSFFLCVYFLNPSSIKLTMHELHCLSLSFQHSNFNSIRTLRNIYGRHTCSYNLKYRDTQVNKCLYSMYTNKLYEVRTWNIYEMLWKLHIQPKYFIISSQKLYKINKINNNNNYYYYYY